MAAAAADNCSSTLGSMAVYLWNCATGSCNGSRSRSCGISSRIGSSNGSSSSSSSGSSSSGSSSSSSSSSSNCCCCSSSSSSSSRGSSSNCRNLTNATAATEL